MTETEIDKSGDMEQRLLAESNWFQRVKAAPAFDQLQALLLDCCRRLNAIHKCDADLAVEPRPKPPTEKFSLQPRSGQESLNAVVTLCAENVVHAEISLKYAKSASGFYRATAQPEAHWKMQQLQDAANASVRALHTLRQGHKKYTDALQRGVPEEELHQFLLSVFQTVKKDIKLARSSLTMPKKKSLVELCNFHSIKSFVPPLPHDILLSFYISSAKLVCAAYQVAVAPNAAKKSGTQQTVTIFQAECQVPHLVEVVHLLNSAFAIAHEFSANFSLPIAHARQHAAQNRTKTASTC